MATSDTTTLDLGPLPPDAARALWERLLADDPTAPSDLAVAYLDPLITWLQRRWPALDPADAFTAASEAIINLAKDPRTYVPERQTLWYYLRMSARGDLKNLQAKEARHRSHLSAVSWDDVEHAPDLGKYVVDEAADPAEVVERVEDLRARLRELKLPDRVRAGLAPEEEKVLELMRLNERRTELYARALGLEGLAPAEQRREVKRVKDRLKKRLERASGPVRLERGGGGE